MNRTALAHLVVSFLVVAPFAAGCDAGSVESESASSGASEASQACAGDDCAPSESAAVASGDSVLHVPQVAAPSAPSLGSALGLELGVQPSFGELLKVTEPQEGLEAGDFAMPFGDPGVTWKEVKKDRFGNVFRLDTEGNLYRFFGDTLKCQVTNKVVDIKMNMHVADEAVAYLVRAEGTATATNNVLYAVMDSSPAFGTNQCPKSERIKSLEGLATPVGDNFKIVSNLKDWELGTTVSMMAINTTGDLVGWRGRNAVFVNNPTVKFEDITMNTCYGTKDKSFSSYVSFLLEKTNTQAKRVLKVKGRNTVAESKWDTRTFKSIAEFKTYYKVCSTGSDAYPPPPPAPVKLTKRISCSSSQYKFQVCDPQIGKGYIDSIKLVKQNSIASCRLGTDPTYGAAYNSMWVSDGCRGDFDVTYVTSTY